MRTGISEYWFSFIFSCPLRRRRRSRTNLSSAMWDRVPYTGLV